MLQTQALEHLKSPRNIFLTGEPGSGKSYTIDRFVEWSLDNGREPVITASTGIAAVNVGGSTLHSWAGIRDDSKLTTEDLEGIALNHFIRKRIQGTEILIIDEISMISAQLLDMVSLVAMHCRGNDLPFGGMRVIMVGDFFQLPPVKGNFAFTSETWNQLDLVVCNLTEQHRQAEGAFINILRKVRQNQELDDEEKEILRDRKRDDVSGLEVKLRLETHNKKVDMVNQTRLMRHVGDPETYTMSKNGNDKAIMGLISSCISPEKLTLKVGVPVMFTRNDPELRWVNGSQGTVTELHEQYVMVQLMGSEKEVHVSRVTWERATGYGANRSVLAAIKQIPLRLAWAITVHKSQGMTLDGAIIDLSRAFAPGQGYVAISRVRSLDHLYFQGRLSKSAFDVDERVAEFYQTLNES